MELDLLVANEIADQLNESAKDATKKGRSKKRGGAKGAVARRDQRRQTYSPAETVKQLNALMDNKGGNVSG